jgi:protein-disulfide isomerase
MRPMPIARRSLLAAAPAALLAQSALAPAAFAQNADPRLGERSVGRADAKAAVMEYFSLTCPHCAAFHNDVWPQVKKELVETGKVRMIFRDFPLDQLALAAAVAARALPAERYEGFVSALFKSQDRWAYARGIDNMGEIAKIAALAGLSRADFDAAQNDQQLKRGILEMRLEGEQKHRVNATPSFVFGGKTQSGELSFERFSALAAELGA